MNNDNNDIDRVNFDTIDIVADLISGSKSAEATDVDVAATNEEYDNDDTVVDDNDHDTKDYFGETMSLF